MESITFRVLQAKLSKRESAESDVKLIVMESMLVHILFFDRSWPGLGIRRN